jgi:hypothetical protein
MKNKYITIHNDKFIKFAKILIIHLVHNVNIINKMIQNQKPK